jgi:hypothetical protein
MRSMRSMPFEELRFSAGLFRLIDVAFWQEHSLPPRLSTLSCNDVIGRDQVLGERSVMPRCKHD